jgi:hypothetical protein
MAKTLGDHAKEAAARCRNLSEEELRDLYAHAMRRLGQTAGKSAGDLDEIDAHAAADELERRGLETE